MFGGFCKRCAACNEWTCPKEREENRCWKCGADPRSDREWLADGVWYAACLVAVPLAIPALVVVVAGLSVRESLRSA